MRSEISSLNHKSSLMFQNLLYTFLIAISISACNQSSDFSDVPELTFISMTKDSLNQGINSDTLFVTLGFTDGDGDISISKNNPDKLNLEVIDLRTGNVSDNFLIPEIPVSGAANGVSGEMTIKMLNTCCIFPEMDSIPPCSVTPLYPDNQLVWQYTLTDDAGNVSNSVITKPISLKCR